MLGITEVIENLYISGLESRQAIVSKGIRSVINISSECPVQDLGPNIEYEKVSLLDLPTTSIQPYFDRLTDRIHQNLQQGKKTLVHCYVGRSRSATIILAYLLRYKQMSLREAFHYLRARRHIIGPNFGFIKQLINYERALYGYTSVSFVNTSFGSVPDIYLSMPTTRARRQTSTAHIPIQAVNSTLGKRASSPTPQRPTASVNFSPARSAFLYSSASALTLPRQHTTLANRSTTSALPTRATTTMSTYANAYNSGASTKNARPVSSSFAYQNPNTTAVSNGTVNKSIFRQPSAVTRLNSTPSGRPVELTREFLAPTKVNSFRTVKYVPSSYNRYHFP